MKIDPTLPQTPLPVSADKGAGSSSSRAAVKTDQTEVTLSARSAELKALETRLAAIPVVDRARVENIKQAIASGQYVINTDNIGEQLLDSVKDMLNAAR